MPKIKDLGIKVIPETMQPPEIGGGAGGGAGCIAGTQCFPTFQPCVPTLHPCLPTHHCWGCTYFISCIGCTHFGYITANCQFLTQGGGCGAISPVCGGSIDPTIVQTPGITREQIASLKEQMQKQIAALDEYAKSIGPSTAQEIDAREKQLNEELAQLKNRRKEADKK
jgi:hypothetical protein